MIEAADYLVSGIVQGVGFRYFVQRNAINLGLKGFVKNLGSGNVEVYAIGTQEQHQKLEKLLNKGPYLSRVDQVQKSKDIIDPGYTDFIVTF